MLKQLKIENFKSWEAATVDFAPLTLLFGANSSGKSSLIHFLLMLKKTLESSDRALALDFGNRDSYVDLGSFRDVIYAHDDRKSLTWKFAWDQSSDIKVANAFGKRSEKLLSGNSFSLEAEVRLRNKIPTNEKIAYSFADDVFSLERESDDRSEFKLTSQKYTFKRELGRGWSLPAPIRSFLFPDQVKTYFQNAAFLSELQEAYINQVSSIYHLGPLRERPERDYRWGGSSPSDVGFRGEKTIDALLAATARKERRNLKYKARTKPFQEMVAFWLKEMGLIEKFHVSAIGDLSTGLYKVEVQKTPYSTPALITDVGFGVSQILPVIVLLYYVPEGSTVILEQPEIHLHPSVQSSLADLFISVTQTRNIQLIVESHSEHLLHRLLRRVAERETSPYPEIEPDNIKAYFCHSGETHSTLEHLKLDMFGRISNWPTDFFGDSFGDVAAREKAALKRK